MRRTVTIMEEKRKSAQKVQIKADQVIPKTITPGEHKEKNAQLQKFLRDAEISTKRENKYDNSNSEV